MSEIRVQTYADKIVNKGGGTKCGSTWEPLTAEKKSNEVRRSMMKVIGADGKPTMQCWRKLRTEQKTTGSDYIIFNCPVCDRRNKRVSYDAKTEEDGKLLVFRCSGCLRNVEVKRPIDLTTSGDNLLSLPGRDSNSKNKIILGS